MQSQQQQRGERRPMHRRPSTRTKHAKPVHIKLIGLDYNSLDKFANAIVQALKTRNYKVSFVRLPTKRLWVHARRTPCGQGSDTFDHFALSIHRRLIVCEISSRDLALIAALPVPNDVWVHLKIAA
ncbi:MAG: 30S ribosomal protein S10 [Crenarchaeota archaeon]|nr:30S ribosomal protein S10 [Thermoproteota archaeon]MCR8453546.1 30S ribosomal protein S10 [Thermoproteota archaeon]MCR8454811.1 30S ribosomal protein S10 [Thermoproteota archaeon]MCR8462703.1 30S ribosomal protein S10 [Thermoproteota archaeon]MCR8470322.1 30S ribosomal protein S10 [Thermoproteota archaeon]